MPKYIILKRMSGVNTRFVHKICAYLPDMLASGRSFNNKSSAAELKREEEMAVVPYYNI